jgi:hypothetical protein
MVVRIDWRRFGTHQMSAFALLTLLLIRESFNP